MLRLPSLMIAALGACLLVIGFVGADKRYVDAQLGEYTSILVVTKAPRRSESPAMAMLRAAPVFEQISSFEGLTVDNVKGKLLVIDKSAFGDADSALLAGMLRADQPIMALDVTLRDLIGRSGYVEVVRSVSGDFVAVSILDRPANLPRRITTATCTSTATSA